MRRAPSRPGPAPSAVAGACGRRCWGSGAPPRSSAARSRRCRCARPAATGCWPPSTPGRRWWWRRPGAEPVAEGGYAAVVLLDTWLMLGRTDLRTVEESLRRWLNAAGARPSAERGGRVVVVGEPVPPGAAGAGAVGPRRLRRPASSRSGCRPTCRPRPGWRRSPAPEDDLTAALATLDLPPGAEVLGPVPVPPAGAAGRPASRRRCARWSGCRGRPGGAVAHAAARCRASGRRASCRRCASRSTRWVSSDRSASVDCGRCPSYCVAARRTARSPAVAVQPIRLFGDPVLRTPAAPVVDFDKELRTLVAGPHRHDARGARRRPGRAADRRRAAGLHLARRRRARPPGQPAS